MKNYPFISDNTLSAAQTQFPVASLDLVLHLKNQGLSKAEVSILLIECWGLPSDQAKALIVQAE